MASTLHARIADGGLWMARPPNQSCGSRVLGEGHRVGLHTPPARREPGGLADYC